MSDFTTFEEMFFDLWRYLGTKDSKYRQKYRKLMHKVRELLRRNTTPGQYLQDKIYEIYKKEVSRSNEEKLADLAPDHRTEEEKLKDDPNRLPPGRLFRYNK